jgi:hypothetical protein
METVNEQTFKDCQNCIEEVYDNIDHIPKQHHTFITQLFKRFSDFGGKTLISPKQARYLLSLYDNHHRNFTVLTRSVRNTPDFSFPTTTPKKKKKKKLFKRGTPTGEPTVKRITLKHYDTPSTIGGKKSFQSILLSVNDELEMYLSPKQCKVLFGRCPTNEKTLYYEHHLQRIKK